jgi:hypothetical protein
MTRWGKMLSMAGILVAVHNQRKEKDEVERSEEK